MLAERINQDSVDRYGYLNYIEETEIEKNKNYTTLANSKLNELNRISDELSLTMHGDYNLQKGVVALIQNNELEINSNYRIDSTNHRISGVTEKVTINISQTNISV